MSGPSVPADGTARSQIARNCLFLYPQLPTVTIITTPTFACITAPDSTPIHSGSTPSELLHLTTELIRQKIAALETAAELCGGCGCCEKVEKEKEQRWDVDWLKEMNDRAREIMAGRRRFWKDERAWLLEEARKRREAERRDRVWGGGADFRGVSGYYGVVEMGREERRTWSE